MNEADTRAKLIDPALHGRGWTEDFIKREVAAGAIDVIGGKARRRARGRIDYTLRVQLSIDTQPVALALIEAKAENLPAAHGIEQVKAYGDSKRLNVAFVFSTNGHQFVMFNRFSRETSKARPLAEFPTPDELRALYEQQMGFSLAAEAARPLLTRYSGGEASRRYYQDAAIRAALEKIARCTVRSEPPRALLSLATGAGKTFIAVNLLRRIADAGQLRRALFICDRDELRTQASGAFQNVFGADAAVVTASDAQKNARILIATYQTLDVASDEATASFLQRHYPADYFSHIVIDECHRSAWGKWSEVLRRNPNAVQVGLTATPRQLTTSEKSPDAQADREVTADNIAHFGEPVYEYDISQGIEDGYLAACEIYQSHINIDGHGVTLADLVTLNPVDAITGQPIPPDTLRGLYERQDFEATLLLPDRLRAMCKDLFDQFVATGGPEQKTIIFCVRDRHADDVAMELGNLYAQWCREAGREPVEHYAFKCTAKGGSDYLADLRGSTRDYFVACTVDLLTTGVDVPAVANIVFFRYVRSPISFYQMVGRGTRLDIPSGKLMFRVYDYTNATRLFGEEFTTRPARTRTIVERGVDYDPDTEGDEDDEELVPLPLVEGIEVLVTRAGHLVLTQVDGRGMPVSVETYKEMLAERLLKEAPTLTAFQKLWIDTVARNSMLSSLPDGGRSALVIRVLEAMDNCDLYDVLGELGYGMAPRTRAQRADAFAYKNENWLGAMPTAAAATVKALAAQFARGGTEELENASIFQTPSVKKAGGLPALQAVGNPADVLRETKERLFAV